MSTWANDLLLLVTIAAAVGGWTLLMVRISDAIHDSMREEN